MWSSDTSEESRAFVQERLALFTRIWAIVILVASAAILAFYRLYPALRPPHNPAVHAAALVGAVGLALVWLAVGRGRRRSLAALQAIDAASLTVIGGLYGLSAYASGARLPSGPFTVLVFHTFAVFSRATLVPSSPARTSTLTAISYVPLVVAATALARWAPASALPLPRPAYVLLFALLAAISTGLATISSHVIYRLRRQVRAALQLGQYTLERRIGEGAMGIVYLARHALLRRPTAVKLLPADRSSAEAVRRFEREVQELGRLTHPNTVAVYDYGRSRDGVFYFAMEYLDGLDLERLVARHGPMPAARVIHVAAQVCGSLAEAHARHLVHRDVKPANVILCVRGLAHDVVKVVDFGLVRQVRGASDQSAVIAGTPAYLAPEAITDPTEAGPASDLYSLGATMYFLLTGARVFDGKTTFELYSQHATVAPVPPSRRAAAPISAALDALVLACLAKAPEHRPASATALRAALLALPEAGDWDEARAAAWWAAVDLSGSDDSAAASSAPTMTIDLAAR